MAHKRKITALLLAGERGGVDEVARRSGVSCKALAPLAGVPMIMRVLDALQESARIDSYVICGPGPDAVESCPRLREFISGDHAAWIPARNDLGGSVLAGLAETDPDALVLITVADHALLDAAILNYFLDGALDSGAGVNVGLVDFGRIEAAYPGVRRTVLKLSDGGYCGCNLYALDGARAGDIVSLWQRAQAHRKQPWRMALGLFGFGALARYACGRLGLQDARDAIMRSTGVAVDFIEIPYARAGIDVDTVADFELVEKILAGGCD